MQILLDNTHHIYIYIYFNMHIDVQNFDFFQLENVLKHVLSIPKLVKIEITGAA